MKLNFIQRFKGQELKKKKDKQNKREKKSYSCDKKRHFTRNCRLNNMMNRRELNVLQVLLVKKSH